MKTLETTHGNISILEPPVEILHTLRDLLPYGLLKFSPTEDGAEFGIVMQCGKDEVFCIKQPALDVKEEEVKEWVDIEHRMCVEALTRYVKEGFSGGYIPAPYLRQQDNGLWEHGVAHFIFPSPRGSESREMPIEESFFDELFGHGSTMMFMNLTGHLKQAFKDWDIPEPGYHGLDVQPRLHLKTLATFFMSVGPHIICARRALREREDAAWNHLAMAGVNQVYHMPCDLMAIGKATGSNLNIQQMFFSQD
jgi:hypothetical protein